MIQWSPQLKLTNHSRTISLLFSNSHRLLHAAVLMHCECISYLSNILIASRPFHPFWFKHAGNIIHHVLLVLLKPKQQYTVLLFCYYRCGDIHANRTLSQYKLQQFGICEFRSSLCYLIWLTQCTQSVCMWMKRDKQPTHPDNWLHIVIHRGLSVCFSVWFSQTLT